MAIVKAEKHERLRLGVGSVGLNGFVGTPNDPNGTDNPNRQSGVVLFSDIPMGVIVTADVDRPVELPESDLGATGSAGATAPYKFELAPQPSAVLVGGFQFQTPNRIFLTGGVGNTPNGFTSKFQMIPTFAGFGTPQVGALVQRGRLHHDMQMPGLTAGNADPRKRNLLRLRWTATVRAAGVFVTGDAVTKTFTGQLNPATADNKIAPGSFVSGNFTVAGKTLVVRDDGLGRLAGFTQDSASPTPNVVDFADGIIDYVRGTFTVSFSTAPAAGAVTAAYEWGCTYIPIDVLATWDSELQ